MILNSPYISGSLTVTGNIIASGSITISGSIASASYASNADLLDGLDSTVFTLTSSFNTTSASLYTVSSSAYATSGSLSATSGSLNTRVSALEATGSALSSSLLTVSGSGYATSGSLSAASGSFNSRVATIESKYATTGSNTFLGNQTVSGSFTVSGSVTATGTITAQTLVVQTITSSVEYSSGSNVFGNNTSNTQVFTGSMFISGSSILANIGTMCIAGTVCTPTTIVSGCSTIGAASSGDDILTVYGATNQGLNICASNQPRLGFYAGGAGADNKVWDIIPQANNTLVGRVLNDAKNSAANWISVTRSGATISCVSFPNGTFYAGGAATFSSSVTAKGDLLVWGGNSAQAGQITANSAGGGLYIAATGTNQNIRLVASGTGIVQSIGAFDVQGAATFSSSVTNAGEYYASVNNTYLRGRNAANTAYIAAIGINGSNKVAIDPDNNGSTFGGAATFSSSITATQGNFINAASNFPLTIDNSTQGYVAQVFKSNNVTFGYIGNANTLNSGGSNTDMVIRSENALILSSSSAERMRITSVGNIGIGTSNPICYSGYTILHIAGTSQGGSGLLHVTNSTCSIRGYIFAEGSACRVTMGAQSNHDVTIHSNDIERIRIMNDGRIGISTNSPTGLLHICANASIIPLYICTSSNNWPVYIKGYDTGINSAIMLDGICGGGCCFGILATGSTNGSSGGGKFVIYQPGVSPDIGGYRLTISGANGFIGVNCAYPKAYMHVVGYNCGQDVCGNADDRGIIHAQTTGALSATVSVQNQYGIGQFMQWGASGMRIGHRILLGGAPGDISITAGQDSIKMVVYCSGNIGAPSGSNIYNASDCRLKKNIRNITYGLSAVMQLQPKIFNWKDNFVSSENGKEMLGFIAQDIQQIIPEVVEQFSDGSDIVFDCQTVTNPLRVNEKFIIPILTKAIQEQQCTICSQASMINLLKTCLGIS